MDIGDRIRSERERLNYTQADFAALGGASKNSQLAWEKGHAMPNAGVLAEYAKAGADVLYILTGQRSQAVAEVDLLPPRQRALLNHYEALSDEGKRNVEGTVSLLAKQTGKKKSA